MGTVVRLAAMCVLSFVLCSCGGGDKPQRGDTDVRISLRLAAEPIGWVDEVVLQIRGVTFIRWHDGREIYYEPREPRQVSLLRAGPYGSAVFSEIVLPADEYRAVRVELDTAANVSDSYVRSLRGEECELRTGASGLTAYGLIDLREAHERSLTVVMNLHRTLHPADCLAGYSLRADFEVVDDQKAGWFTGSVDPSLVLADCDPKVYAFLQGAVPDDVADAAAPRSNPVSVAQVHTQAGLYRYRTRAFPPMLERDEAFPENSPLCRASPTLCFRPARYLLAFTCDIDDPIADEDVRFGPIVQVPLQSAGASEVNLQP